MEPHSPRFSDTPPGSPKSCMKGSRKLTFEKPGESSGGGSETTSSTSTTTTTTSRGGTPRSPKSVSIRMHGDGGGGGTSSSSSSSARGTSFDLPSTSSKPPQGPVQKKRPPPAEIQFQVQITEHFDQSTPPPNCTSNGNYDYDNPEAATTSQQASTGTNTSYEDLRQDPQLVEIATKFVNDIIENAKVEAASRAKAEPTQTTSTPGTSSERDSFSNGIGRGAAGNWVRRAHGLVSKWITNICVKAQNIKADLK